MTISDDSWSPRIRQIADLERQDHWYLRDTDKCYLFGEYSSGKGWAHSTTNQLVSNLKKDPALIATSQWVHKLNAIHRISAAIRANLKADALVDTAFVPVPPSKPPNHPDYDDRMVQVARSIDPNCDVREILFASEPRDPRHTSGARRDPAALRASLDVRTDLLRGLADRPIVLLDDVLTTGCSYTVCHDILAELLPSCSIVGVFVARRVVRRASEDFAEIEF